MKKIRTLLIDLDDTLIVEKAAAHASFLETISELESIPDKEQFVKSIRQEARKLWYTFPTIDYCKKIGISSWEGLWAEFTGDDPNLKKLAELRDDYRFNAWNNALIASRIRNRDLALKLGADFARIRNGKHALFPDVLPFLKYVTDKYTLVMVTNGAPDIQWKKILGGKLDKLFRAILISGELGTGKPDPPIFREALLRADCKPENALMIGDSPTSDIGGAKSMGIQSVWMRRNSEKEPLSELQPDYIVQDFDLVAKLLSELDRSA